VKARDTEVEAALELARELVRAPSVTPEDAGCQRILTDRLQALGFAVHDLSSGPVRNFYARFGAARPIVCLAGHTDVVAPGPEADWTAPPFDPVLRDGRLYGRGAADMKGALAAMVCAVEGYLAEAPHTPGSIAFLVTGDEEGDAAEGTARMVEWLKARDELPDFCIVGEPSSTEALGDTVKHGRRGSVTGDLVVHGVQGHVAFPERADNPIHNALAALDALAAHHFDDGDDHFQPTTLQMSNLHAGTGATNVIPGHLSVCFNLRFSPRSTPASIDRQVREILDRDGLRYDLTWHVSGHPFLTAEGPLTEALRAAVHEVTGRTPALSTTGGTSDARFIAPEGVAVAELGLVNRSIHMVDEWAAVDDLGALARVYRAALKRLLGVKGG
jgi:succinyl-diaminopimelate desuccinylase